MQTQIDLFPLGTCYYSQILISPQIPPVPPVSSHLLPGQDPSQEGRVSWSCSWSGAGKQAANQPLCHVLSSSPRGIAAAATAAETRLVTLGKGKPTRFQLSPNQPPIMRGINQLQADPSPAVAPWLSQRTARNADCHWRQGSPSRPWGTP